MKKGDSVIVCRTQEVTVVETVSEMVPPIWCENGCGYFAHELLLVASTPVEWSATTVKVAKEAALYMLCGSASHWEKEELMELAGITYDQAQAVVKELTAKEGARNA